jgi:predicted ATPase
MVMTGDRDAGLIELRDGLERWRGTGAKLWAPYRLGRAAAAFLEAGEIYAGSRLLSDALRAVKTGGERWNEAELYRLKGELLLVSSVDAQAEAQACLRRALTIAHAQGARLFELRAAMALSRLQCDREERSAAIRFSVRS